MLVIVLATGMLSFSAAAAGGLYKWQDSKGLWHFGDQPPANGDSERLIVETTTYSFPTTNTHDDQNAGQPAQGKRRVVMYAATWCGYCKKARNYFRSQGIAFTEYDVETSAKGRQDYKRLGGSGVPIILVGDRRMNGFSVDGFRKIYQ